MYKVNAVTFCRTSSMGTRAIFLTNFLDEIWGIMEKMADPPRQLDCVGDSGPTLRSDRVLGGDWTGWEPASWCSLNQRHIRGGRDIFPSHIQVCRSVSCRDLLFQKDIGSVHPVGFLVHLFEPALKQLSILSLQIPLALIQLAHLKLEGREFILDDLDRDVLFAHKVCQLLILVCIKLVGLGQSPDPNECKWRMPDLVSALFHTSHMAHEVRTARSQSESGHYSSLF